MNIRELATGLQFPEGPIAMDDGSVLLVEIARGTLTRVTADGRVVAKASELIDEAAAIEAIAAHPWVGRGALKLAHALDLLAVGRLQFVGLDGAATDLGHAGRAAVGEAGIALHAEEDEGRKDQHDQGALEQTGVRTDEIEHEAEPLRVPPRPGATCGGGPRNSKGEPGFAFEGWRVRVRRARDSSQCGGGC